MATKIKTLPCRHLFRQTGHYVYASFEQWELAFMRDSHPWREILIWEAICRAYEAYLAKHPEAANDAKIVPALAAWSVRAIGWHISKTVTSVQEVGATTPKLARPIQHGRRPPQGALGTWV
jgi:hypothetical protein